MMRDSTNHRPFDFERQQMILNKTSNNNKKKKKKKEGTHNEIEWRNASVSIRKSNFNKT